jgi:hypothetical protein
MSTRAHVRTAATNILRNHFDTEASDAGLRSLDLASTGAKCSSSYDSSAVARAERGHGRDHQRVRASLKRLSPKHVEIITLAYGERLRTRDIEDGKHRRAVRQNERNWRVRLAELYGADGLIALVSPLAQRLFRDHVEVLEAHAEDQYEGPAIHPACIDMQSAEDVFAKGRNAVLSAPTSYAVQVASEAAAGGLVAWLLNRDSKQTAQIAEDARRSLNEALDAFAEAHGITPAEPASRRRSSERTRTRILALHPEHGQVIGR